MAAARKRSGCGHGMAADAAARRCVYCGVSVDARCAECPVCGMPVEGVSAEWPEIVIVDSDRDAGRMCPFTGRKRAVIALVSCAALGAFAAWARAADMKKKGQSKTIKEVR